MLLVFQKLFFLAKSKVSGLKFVTTHDRMTEKRFAPVAQAVANVTSSPQLAIKIASSVKYPMALPGCDAFFTSLY